MFGSWIRRAQSFRSTFASPALKSSTNSLPTSLPKGLDRISLITIRIDAGGGVGVGEGKGAGVGEGARVGAGLGIGDGVGLGVGDGSGDGDGLGDGAGVGDGSGEGTAGGATKPGPDAALRGVGVEVMKSAALLSVSAVFFRAKVSPAPGFGAGLPSN